MQSLFDNFDAIAGLVCLTSLCGPGLGFILGLAVTGAMRALLGIGSSRPAETPEPAERVETAGPAKPAQAAKASKLAKTPRTARTAKSAESPKGPLPLPWLVAQYAVTGGGIAFGAKVLASILDMPFTPWGYLATLAGCATLVVSTMFTGAGVEELQGETNQATERNMYGSLAALIAGAAVVAFLLA